MTIDEAMEIAGRHHQAGRLATAEEIYRRVLAHVPDHAGALHLLGVVAAQTGHLDAAIDLIGRAIAVDPASAEHHNSLGEAYRQSGQRDRAMACLSRAIELKPGYADAHNNLGNTLKDLGHLDEAIAAYRRAIELEPGCAGAESNLAVALYQTGRPEEAIAACRRAIARKPDDCAAHINLAIALHATGRLDESIAACRRVLELRPELADAHTSLGNALKDVGRFEEAIAAYRQAIALLPDRAAVHSDLGAVFCEAGRHDEAIAAHRHAIALSPEYAEAHSNLGIALYDTGRLDEAIAAYRRAIALKPGLAVAHNNLAGIFKDQGRLDMALGGFRRALELKPDFSEAASNILFTVLYHPDFDAQAILAEHRDWSRRHAEPLAAEIRPHHNDRSPDRKLRVGFVSPDFCDHPVGQSLLPLFTHRDRHQTEVVCYSDVRVADPVTAKLQGLADQWHSTLGLSDPQVADRVRDGRIDILVDLTLHTANNRLLVFARKPAPVQVSMLAMPSTTGLATMDYRLTDPYLDPAGSSDADYTERSIRLPRCYWCYQPMEGSPPVGELPARKNGFVTFGCLNQFAKVSRPTLELWSTLLRSLPTSRLVLHSLPGSHRERMLQLFQDAGIAGERVEFTSRVPRPAYLERYHDLDLCLDPFPFNGAITTMDSLWMGVPVVTLAGRTGVGRSGVSILSNVGFPEWIAETPEQYVATSRYFGPFRERGDQVGAGSPDAGAYCLCPRMLASPLLDGARFAADVEGGGGGGGGGGETGREEEGYIIPRTAAPAAGGPGMMTGPRRFVACG